MGEVDVADQSFDFDGNSPPSLCERMRAIREEKKQDVIEIDDSDDGEAAAVVDHDDDDDDDDGEAAYDDYDCEAAAVADAEHGISSTRTPSTKARNIGAHRPPTTTTTTTTLLSLSPPSPPKQPWIKRPGNANNKAAHGGGSSRSAAAAATAASAASKKQPTKRARDEAERAAAKAEREESKRLKQMEKEQEKVARQVRWGFYVPLCFLGMVNRGCCVLDLNPTLLNGLKAGVRWTQLRVLDLNSTPAADVKPACV
jgi:hypothetical protein